MPILSSFRDRVSVLDQWLLEQGHRAQPQRWHGLGQALGKNRGDVFSHCDLDLSVELTSTPAGLACLPLALPPSSTTPFNGWLFEIHGAGAGLVPFQPLTALGFVEQRLWSPGATPFSETTGSCEGFLPPHFDVDQSLPSLSAYPPRQARELLLAAGFREAALFDPGLVDQAAIAELDQYPDRPRLTSDLEEAAIRGQSRIAATLAPKATQDDIQSALGLACDRGFESVARALLPYADPSDNARPIDYEEGDSSPLMSAARHGRVECVRLLLDAGFPPFRDDDYAEIFHSPISLAAHHSPGVVFELLLLAGARKAVLDPSREQVFLNIAHDCPQSSAEPDFHRLFETALGAERSALEAQAIRDGLLSTPRPASAKRRSI